MVFYYNTYCIHMVQCTQVHIWPFQRAVNQMELKISTSIIHQAVMDQKRDLLLKPLNFCKKGKSWEVEVMMDGGTSVEDIMHKEPMGQGYAELLVGYLSFHSRRTNTVQYDLLTHNRFLWKFSHCLPHSHVFFFFLSGIHILAAKTHLHTLSLNVLGTLCCAGGAGWMVSGIEVHNKLELILLHRTLHSGKEKMENKRNVLKTTQTEDLASHFLSWS